MTFALITEGPSEYRILRHILNTLFEDPEITPVQPKMVNNKQDGPGGWNEVLNYCTRETELQNIFVDNDYLIIQIDTDKSSISPFDVSHINAANEEKTVEEFHSDIVAKLIGLIPAEFLQLLVKGYSLLSVFIPLSAGCCPFILPITRQPPEAALLN